MYYPVVYPVHGYTGDLLRGWFTEGVSIVERILQCLQVESRVSLKLSLGVLVIIKFSVAHSGQVNRITYPVLVPFISGLKAYFFIVVFFLVVFLSGATISGLVTGVSVQKRFRRR
jgi:hypothetical protein